MLDSMRSTPVALSSILNRLDQLGRIKSKLAYSLCDARPFLGQKVLPFTLHQASSRAIDDEHPDAASFFNQFVVDQRLVGFRHRERIDLEIDRNLSHGRQRLALLE